MSVDRLRFRGMRVSGGEWVYGDVVHHRCGKVSICQDPARWGYGATEGYSDLVDPKTVGQSTGLTDNNKSLTCVFECDIVDDSGIVKGNIYESPQIYREGIDIIIARVGTKAWRESESIAMGRGCRYAE